MFCLRLISVALVALLSTVSVQAQSGGSFFDENEPQVYRPVKKITELSNQGQKREALALAESELKKNEKNVQIRFLRGVLLNDLNRKDEARSVFEQMIRDYPEIAEPYNNLAVMYASEGNIGQAKELLERAVSNNSKSFVTFSNLGDIYLAQARDAYRQALRIAPGNKRMQKRLNEVELLLK